MPDPIRRTTARVLPVTGEGEVLLLQDRDPAHPGVLRWCSIGGAVDPGESLIDAALRELEEETGIEAEPSQLTHPFLRLADDGGGVSDDLPAIMEAAVRAVLGDTR